jgi:hypothetical protein
MDGGRCGNPLVVFYQSCHVSKLVRGNPPQIHPRGSGLFLKRFVQRVPAWGASVWRQAEPDL